MKRFSVIGTSHKIAPLEIREAIAFAPGEIPDALHCLRDEYGVPQSLLVSTCNRTEIITFSECADIEDRVMRFLKQRKGVDAAKIRKHMFSYQGVDAIRHLYEVAASLDSLVLGEYQILSQLKQAFSSASEADGTGKALNVLMHSALKVGKEVRASTGIGSGQLSVASVAVSFIRRTFDDLEKKTALLIGIGETGLITLRHLKDAGVGSIIIANRTLSRAQQAAREFDGQAVPLSELSDVLASADIVVSQTSASQPIITPRMAGKALKERGYRSMFIVDLAVPRDIEPKVGKLDGVYRYDVDDLQRVVEQTLEQRSAEMQRCEEMLEERVQAFVNGFRAMRVDPILAGIRAHADQLIQEELDRSSRKLDQLNQSERDEVERVIHRVVAKLLHPPMLAIKDEAREPTLGPEVWPFVESLFDLRGVLTTKGDQLAQPSRRARETGKLPTIHGEPIHGEPIHSEPGKDEPNDADSADQRAAALEEGVEPASSQSKVSR